jgi:hypothetical protein
MNIPLYPTPRSLSVVCGFVMVPESLTVSGAPGGLLPTIPGLAAVDAESGWIRLAIDEQGPSEAGGEAYRLAVTATGVEISARTATGLRCALFRRRCPAC